MKNINWIDRVKNEEVLQRGKNDLHGIKGRKLTVLVTA
jgi:hypothetical protein